MLHKGMCRSTEQVNAEHIRARREWREGPAVWASRWGPGAEEAIREDTFSVVLGTRRASLCERTSQAGSRTQCGEVLESRDTGPSFSAFTISLAQESCRHRGQQCFQISL